MATTHLALTDDYAAGDVYPAAQANAVAQAVDAAWGGLEELEPSVGTEAADVIAVTLQVRRPDATAVTAHRLVQVWLVDTGEADAPLTASPPSGGWAATTGTMLHEPVADKLAYCVTAATGELVLEIEASGAGTWHLVAALAGRPVTAEIAFT